MSFLWLTSASSFSRLKALEELELEELELEELELEELELEEEDDDDEEDDDGSCLVSEGRELLLLDRNTLEDEATPEGDVIIASRVEKGVLAPFAALFCFKDDSSYAFCPSPS